MWLLIFRKCSVLGCGHLPVLLQILSWPGLVKCCTFGMEITQECRSSPWHAIYVGVRRLGCNLSFYVAEEFSLSTDFISHPLEMCSFAFLRPGAQTPPGEFNLLLVLTAARFCLPSLLFLKGRCSPDGLL